MVLRAYCRYMLQTGVAFSQSYMEQVLASNASIAATAVAALRSAVRSGARRDAPRKRDVARVLQNELAQRCSMR